MPFPEGWPPSAPSKRSFRFYQTGAATAAFEDNAWMFSSADSVCQPLPFVRPGSTDPVVVPQVAGGGRNENDVALGVRPPVPTYVPRFLLIFNDDAPLGTTLQVSFDGTNIHAEVLAGEAMTMEDRLEGGVSVRHDPAGSPVPFRVIAW